MTVKIILVSSLLFLSAASLAQDRSFSVVAFGDMPYVLPADYARFENLIKVVNEEHQAFNVHVGDIKSSSTKCTEEYYQKIYNYFQQFNKPLIYTPGDNEWTDCHRTNTGRYDNLERLDHVRKVMFAGPERFGATRMKLDHQGKPGEKLAENTRFVHEGIVFVGLNIPGSNNNKVGEKDCTAKSARTPEQCAADNAEYAERDAANIAWMHEAFELAKQRKAAGIVLVLQADPWFDLPETEDVDERQAPGADGYTNFLAKLVEETKAFPGQVLFVHGDTHFFKVDKPLLRQDDLVENFTRIETFGSPNVHWVKVTVDPKARELFTIHPMLVRGN